MNKAALRYPSSVKCTTVVRQHGLCCGPLPRLGRVSPPEQGEQVDKSGPALLRDAFDDVPIKRRGRGHSAVDPGAVGPGRRGPPVTSTQRALR